MNLIEINGTINLSKGERTMTSSWNETLVEKTVTYSLEINGKLFLIENVPARVNLETGEQFFSPSTVEILRQIVLSQKKPVRFIETPVYDFVA
jgi:YgiT-type zinc finger domain-containing protein